MRLAITILALLALLHHLVLVLGLASRHNGYSNTNMRPQPYNTRRTTTHMLMLSSGGGGAVKGGGASVAMGLPTVSGENAGPSLVLISGCTGSGKSTFGMEVAVREGILKCISTITIRQVQREYDDSPALHRSTFEGDGEAIHDWLECCSVLQDSVDGIVEDSLRRGVSLVLEGVHIVPNNALIDKWTKGGGVAVGVVMTIPNSDTHKEMIARRGYGAQEQLQKFDRIRAIHDEMARLGVDSGWLSIDQVPSFSPKPLDLLTERLKNTWIEGTSQRLMLSSNSILLR